jgi:hypothetical protein
MNIVTMENKLAEDMRSLFADYKAKDPITEKDKALTVFLDDLPVQKAEDDDDSQLVPWIIVKSSQGQIQSDVDTTDAILVICTYEGASSSDGSHGAQDVLNIIDRIKTRVRLNPILSDMFEMEFVEWTLQDPDVSMYPYYMGAVRLRITMPDIVEEAISEYV